jgi:hypothetical protein
MVVGEKCVREAADLELRCGELGKIGWGDVLVVVKDGYADWGGHGGFVEGK